MNVQGLLLRGSVAKSALNLLIWRKSRGSAVKQALNLLKQKILTAKIGHEDFFY